jgi:hypothetical protein
MYLTVKRKVPCEGVTVPLTRIDIVKIIWGDDED